MPSIPKKLRTLLAIGIPGLVIIVLLVLFGDAENPKQISLNRLRDLKQEVTEFINANGRAPADLAELGLPVEQLQDHLGEPFKYIVTEHDITLLSYGSDKKPGGSFFKQDYSVTIDLPK